MPTKESRGRKPTDKTWDVKFGHMFRTTYADNSDLHILMFLAGEHANRLLQIALREFASNRKIPINDAEFQESVFMQASVMQARNKRPAHVRDVMQAINKTALHKQIVTAIIDESCVSQSQPITEVDGKDKPTQAIGSSIQAAQVIEPVLTVNPAPLVTHAVQLHPVQPAPACPPPPLVSKKAISIDMGDDLEEQPKTDDSPSAASRWLAGRHDY